MTIKTKQMLDYCLSIAQEFEARMNRLRIFTKHNLSSGDANELILRDFLSLHAPKDFCVGQGFICDPLKENSASKQCDILIYRQSDVPLVYSDGPVKVVWPEAAKMVIEVKTTLNGDSLKEALDNVISAKKLDRRITGVIFAFKSQSVETTIEHLQNYEHHILNEFKPTVILLLDKGVIIHRWFWSRHQDLMDSDVDPSTYAVLTAKENGAGIVMTFLLLLFFEVVGSGRGAYSTEMINLLLGVLEDHTDKRPEDVYVGRKEP